MKKQQKEPELSIIILSYNVRQLLLDCLDAVYKFNRQKIAIDEWEIIVVDNNSPDDSVAAIKEKKYPCLKLVENKENSGFAGANNLAVKNARGQYILFLNPDTLVGKDSITAPLDYLKSDPEIGAATVKVELGNGQLDYSCHRGFPTPWNSFCWFSGLSKLFPKSEVFSGYALGHLDINKPHEVDAITGAFFMLPRKLGDKLGWFDTDFFWNGEDLDLCFRIKEAGYKIIYLPQAKITHNKGSSGGHKKGSKSFYSRFEAMKIFYDKHYRNKYPEFVKWLVHLGINLRMLFAYLWH